ncbi:hypothetical protein M4R22_13245 [Acidovorax sp. GBBC 3334]|nr:hypothetical protein [Acidovorax sp. GBBC 3334]MDA8455732.1 hypothetical protein [Acidovorax sp. GBBC 3334]
MTTACTQTGPYSAGKNCIYTASMKTQAFGFIRQVSSARTKVAPSRRASVVTAAPSKADRLRSSDTPIQATYSAPATSSR